MLLHILSTHTRCEKCVAKPKHYLTPGHLLRRASAKAVHRTP